MSNGYTTYQIAKIIGEKYQRLRGWIDTGAIVPSIKQADGPGVKAQFSLNDVYRIGLFKELLHIGFSRGEAGEWVKWMADVLKTQDHPRYRGGKCEQLLFVKHDGTFHVKFRPLRQDKFNTLSLKEIFTHYHSDAGLIDYDSFAVVNFKKIVNDISKKIEEL